MPKKPKRPCSYQGCPELTDGRFCQKHQKAYDGDYNRRLRDMSAQEFYSSRAWRMKRHRHLTDEPLCRECRKAGRITRATLVDHIIPIRQGGEPLDDDNLQSLCASCHSAKSITEGSRFGGS